MVSGETAWIEEVKWSGDGGIGMTRLSHYYLADDSDIADTDAEVICLREI